MPCSDGTDYGLAVRVTQEFYDELLANRAMLCGLLTAVRIYSEDHLLGPDDPKERFKSFLEDNFNENDAGVKIKDMLAWWSRHRRADRRRRRAEKMEAKLEAERQAAIAKLTPHEIKLLGIKAKGR
jgi:hypothetical protein